MLAEYRLDTENFRDIMDDAKNMAVSLHPEWTDFNYHDPGITMLELFSWIKEGQQYFLDQIGTEHKKKYLKLLGMNREHRMASQALVMIKTQEDVSLLKGTKLSAGVVQFETTRRQCVTDNRIIRCFHGKTELEHICIGENIEENDNLRLPVFGTEPEAGDAWYVGFEKPLPADETVGIFISLVEALEDGKRRNPIHGHLYAPLLHLRYEYYAKGSWHGIEGVEDDTYSMLESGMLYVTVAEKMEAVSVFGENAYYIRIRVEESDIDVPPVLERIRLNMVHVIQKDTWAEAEETTAYSDGDTYVVRTQTYAGMVGSNELYYKREEVYYPVPVSEKYIEDERNDAKILFDLPLDAGILDQEDGFSVLIVSYLEQPRLKKCLGIGNGMPYQEMDLRSNDILYESVEILVHEIESPGGFSRWKRVPDFGASTTEDKHFVIDTEEGKICFGDCEHGMAPEGPVILLAFAETKGEEGNVKQGTIDRFTGIVSDELYVHNGNDAVGGKEEETIEECFFRARRLLKAPKTAVTYADYERRIMETPGLYISSCHVIPTDELAGLNEHVGENTLAVVVAPVNVGKKKTLSACYRRNILAYLEQYRMLGMKIELLAARYIPLDVTLEVVTKPHFLNAEGQIRETVEQHFAALQKQFGAVIVYSELYGIIDMLDCVAEVRDIMLDIRDGKVVRTQDGNVRLPPNGVIELNHVQYIFSLSD